MLVQHGARRHAVTTGTRVAHTPVKQWKRATRMLLTLPAISSAPAVMMRSHLPMSYRLFFGP